MGCLAGCGFLIVFVFVTAILTGNWQGAKDVSPLAVPIIILYITYLALVGYFTPPKK